MTDIIKRLVETAHTYDEAGVHSDLELEAAEEIAQLRNKIARQRLEINLIKSCLILHPKYLYSKHKVGK